MTPRTVVATDGSSLGNPGPAGWAWVAMDGRQDWASVRRSTNNRMELAALLGALRSTPGEALLVQADSQYVINVFTQWLPTWRKKGMRTSSRKAVENAELILEIDEVLSSRDVSWEWVRGHSGHPLNERADSLARHAAERSRILLETGRIPPGATDPPRLTARDQRG